MKKCHIVLDCIKTGEKHCKPERKDNHSDITASFLCQAKLELTLQGWANLITNSYLGAKQSLQNSSDNFALLYAIMNGLRYEPHHDKTNKISLHPAKTQISLGIRPVWSESSLCAQWVAKDTSFLHADSEDSDQTGRTAILLVLSCIKPSISPKESSINQAPYHTMV